MDGNGIWGRWGVAGCNGDDRNILESSSCWFEEEEEEEEKRIELLVASGRSIQYTNWMRLKSQ
jgi:hypothetical protein